MQPRMTLSFKSDAEMNAFKAIVYANAAADGRSLSETIVDAVLQRKSLCIPEDVSRCLEGSVNDGPDVVKMRTEQLGDLAQRYRDAHLVITARGK